MKCTEWIKQHKKPLVIAAAIVAFVALALGLSLGLTLPVKSVEVEGELFVLRGESYTGGLTIKQTTRAGLVHREDVLSDMIEGFDSSAVGEQEILVNYRDWQVKKTVTVIDPAEIELRVREGTLPASYSPNESFPTTGIFDLYYEGEILRSAPIIPASAPDFSTMELGSFPITLRYSEGIECGYSYSVSIPGSDISEITSEGTLYVPQGVLLSKSNLLGSVKLKIKYARDGEIREVYLKDEAVGVPEIILDKQSADYSLTIKLTYNGAAVSCSAIAYAGELLDVSELRLIPTKTVYKVGDTFDAGLNEIEVKYAKFDGVIRMLTTPSMFTETITFTEPREDYPITVRFNGKNATASVRVIGAADVGFITDLDTTWQGGKDGGSPHTGEALNYDGAYLDVEYGYGYFVDRVKLTEDMVSGYNPDKAGIQTIFITYEGPQNTRTDPFTILVAETGSTQPTAIIAVVGWTDNYVTYLDDKEPNIPDTAYLDVQIGYGIAHKAVYLTDEDVEITGFTPGVKEQEITIEYGGLTETFYLTLEDRSQGRIRTWLAVPDFSFDPGAEPAYGKIFCSIGYNFGDPDSMTLAEILADGGVIDWGDGFDANESGPYSVTVRYPKYGLETQEITATVTGPYITGMRFDAAGAKKTYVKGEKIDLEGMELWLDYSVGDPVNVTDELTEASFPDFSTEFAESKKTATLTYSKGRFRATANYVYDVVEATE